MFIGQYTEQNTEILISTLVRILCYFVFHSETRRITDTDAVKTVFRFRTVMLNSVTTCVTISSAHGSFLAPSPGSTVLFPSLGGHNLLSQLALEHRVKQSRWLEPKWRRKTHLRISVRFRFLELRTRPCKMKRVRGSVPT